MLEFWVEYGHAMRVNGFGVMGYFRSHPLHLVTVCVVLELQNLTDIVATSEVCTSVLVSKILLFC